MAAALRGEGLLLREIAERMGGVAVQTVHAWLSDPDGSKLRARKDSYRGECMDCGTMTSGHEGRRAEPRCLACGNRRAGEARKVWTRERIVEAIRAWHDRFGRIPTLAEWSPTIVRDGHAPAHRSAVYLAEPDQWPHFYTVWREFGSWPAAIRAAGFTPRKRGTTLKREGTER